MTLVVLTAQVIIGSGSATFVAILTVPTLHTGNSSKTSLTLSPKIFKKDFRAFSLFF